jgi:hypothetical protein
MKSLVLHIFSALGLINALALVRSEDFLRERERERERERCAGVYNIVRTRAKDTKRII